MGNINSGLLKKILMVYAQFGLSEIYNYNWITKIIQQSGHWDGREAKTPARSVNVCIRTNQHIFFSAENGDHGIIPEFIEEHKRYFELLQNIIQTDVSYDDAKVMNDYDAVSLEGERKFRLSVYYERDTSLRKAAISRHGVNCFGCNFNFEKEYGKFGFGFIEIHHVNPLHLLSKPNITTIAKDLVPLCSNCHRIVHRDPSATMPISQLRNIVKQHKYE